MTGDGENPIFITSHKYWPFVNKEQWSALAIFLTMSGTYQYIHLLQEPMYNNFAYYVHKNHEKIILKKHEMLTVIK